jgi:hypothetical protein
MGMNTTKQLLSVGLALITSGLVSCSIPKPECTVGQSSTNGIGLTGVAAFAVRYKLSSGTGECANMKGEVVGFQSYHPADPSDPKTRDFSKTSIAIRPMSLGELQWMKEDLVGPAEQFCYDGEDDDEDGNIDDKDDDCHVNAIGDFTESEPDGSEMCQVPTLSASGVNFAGASATVDAEVECDPANGTADCDDIMDVDMVECVSADPMDPMAAGTCMVTYTYPETNVSYVWKNVQVYVTAGVVGTQFTADMTLTVNGDSCEYKAIGMWPAVDCGVHDPMTGAVTATDLEFCNPEPDNAGGRPVGSGISPDFGPVVCDTEVGLLPPIDDYYTDLVLGHPLSVPRCVLDTDTIPALDCFKGCGTDK